MVSSYETSTAFNPELACDAYLSEQHSLLNRLTAPLSTPQVCALLTSIATHYPALQPHERFDEESYCRNRILRNEHVDLLLLCWRSGQRTPIHNHAGSTCGVYVIRGEAIEIVFSGSDAGLLLPTRSERLTPGAITVSHDTEAHLVGNFGAPGSDLVTLHCYSPPLRSMQTYSQEETFFADYVGVTQRAAQSGYYHLGEIQGTTSVPPASGLDTPPPSPP